MRGASDPSAALVAFAFCERFNSLLTAATGWSDGLLRVDLRGANGQPVPDLPLEALVGRLALSAEDRTVTFQRDRDGHDAPADLTPGAGRVEPRSVDGPAYALVQQIFVPEAR